MQGEVSGMIAYEGSLFGNGVCVVCDLFGARASRGVVFHISDMPHM
jgi:hypothetical protein